MKHFLWIALLFSIPGRADDVYQFVIQKQEKKKDTRWSLSQWLETRDRMRLMDLWLALHTSSPYEFYLGGEYQFGKADGSVGFNANSGMISLVGYARIFGLEVQQQFRLAEWAALFHLRIFGLHVQGTNLTLHGGLRHRKDPASYLTPLAGVSLTFYLFKNFGVGGLYRHYFGALENTTGISESGHRFEGETFIDFSFVRMYLQVFSEILDRSAGPGAPTHDRNGISVGTKIFF